MKICILNLIWVGFLGVSFAVGEGSKTTPCLNVVRIILEAWNLVSTHTYAVLENMAFSTKTSLVLLMSAFFGKNQHFFGQTVTFTESNSMRAV